MTPCTVCLRRLRNTHPWDSHVPTCCVKIVSHQLFSPAPSCGYSKEALRTEGTIQVSSPPCLPPPCSVRRPGGHSREDQLKTATTMNKQTQKTAGQIKMSQDPDTMAARRCQCGINRVSEGRAPTAADEGGGCWAVKVCFLPCGWHFTQLSVTYPLSPYHPWLFFCGLDV